MNGLRRWLRYWYRRAGGRCVICGGERVYSSAVWHLPVAYACGWCNKRIQHGFNYGMSGAKLQQTLHEQRGS